MIIEEDMKIVSQTELAPSIFELVLTGQLSLEPSDPGQFVDVLIPNEEMGLRRPFGIAKRDLERNEITLIYRVVGDGTDILSKQTAGLALNVLGPLGHGFPIDFLRPKDRVLVVGGGLGTPPLYELGRQLALKDAEIDFALGYNGKELMYYTEEFKQLGNTSICTMDGSVGFKGHLGQLLDAKFDNQAFAAVYACGPTGVLMTVDNRYKDHPHAYVSLESRMACGIGACYACVVHENSTEEVKSKKVCDDGPVFRTGEVIIA